MSASIILLPDQVRLRTAVNIITEDQLMMAPQPQWIVKGVIPAVGVGAIYGQPGSCKSFLCIDLGAHLAMPGTWHGFKIKRATPVLYIPFEGQSGIPKRVRAWQQFHRRQTGMRFIMHALNLADPGARRDLIQELVRQGFRGGVIILDTLAAAFPGVKENDSESMGGVVIKGAKELSDALQCVVLIVHHSGKDESKGLRGWSGLLGALDFAIECRPAKAGAHDIEREFVLAKVKDDATGRAVPFSVKVEVLGFDEDGDPVTSLVVTTRLQDSAQQKQPAAERNARHDRLVWQWVHDEVAAGRFPSGRSMEGQRVAKYPDMSQKELRDAIARLEAANRLGREGTGRQQYLRSMEPTPGAGPP